MVTAREKLTALFNKQLNGTITAPEKEELAFYAMQEELQPILEQLVNESWHITGEDKDISEMKSLAIQDYILQPVSEQAAPRRTLQARWWWAAAAMLIITAGTIFLYTKGQDKNMLAEDNSVQTEIGPGGQGAILTLSNGRQISLDSTASRSITDKNGVTAIVNNGRLQYQQELNKAGEITYHTVSTPRGRQFQLVLPDGTRVWLNTASSITYPTSFSGENRKVNITGEVYFEVSANSPAHPFIVSSRLQTVTVLGTRFNINSYEDGESVKTTLCSGKVRVTTNHSSENNILQPGEQAQIIAGHPIQIKHADITQVIAWQNGYFNFSNTPFAEIMRQLARWYDIDVKYAHNIPGIEFEGKLNQSVNLSRVLEFLKESGIRFNIHEKTLTIL